MLQNKNYTKVITPGPPNGGFIRKEILINGSIILPPHPTYFKDIFTVLGIITKDLSVTTNPDQNRPLIATKPFKRVI